MTSTASLVREAINKDVFLQVALSRNLVNAREVARRIKDAYGIDDTIANISNAIRRHAERIGGTSLEDAHDALAKTRVDHHPGISLLAMPRTEKAVECLHRLERRLNLAEGDSLQVLQAQGTLTLIIDSTHRDVAHEIFGDALIKRAQDQLTELHIVPPDAPDLAAGVMVLAQACLHANGIRLVAVLSTPEHRALVVPESEGWDAYRLLDSLTTA